MLSQRECQSQPAFRVSKNNATGQSSLSLPLYFPIDTPIEKEVHRSHEQKLACSIVNLRRQRVYFYSCFFLTRNYRDDE